MELLLNLFWMSLLLPAYLLWQWRASSSRSTRGSIVFICTLGCVLVLLFPVISASDDLHSIGQAMEESDRGFRHGGHHDCHGACSQHLLAHASRAALLTSAPLKVAFEPVEDVLSWSPRSSGTYFAFLPAGRAPPQRSLSL
jgi:hypothetical protein